MLPTRILPTLHGPIIRPSTSFMNSAIGPIIRPRFFSSTPAARLARLTLVGRLAADPEITVTSTGQEMIKYAVASSSGPADNRKTSWFRVGAFNSEGGRRDYIMGLKKGTLVYVEADTRLATYEGEDGKSHTHLNLLHRNVQVLSRPRDDTEVAEGAEERNATY